MSVKRQKMNPVTWSAGQLERIGKPDYSGVAQALASTGYNGKKLVKK